MSRLQRHALIVVAIAVIAALVFLLWPQPTAEQQDEPPPVTAPTAPVPAGAANEAAPQRIAAPIAVALTPGIDAPGRATDGSAPDGDVGVDADGRLRIDLALRRYFDWHRTALGEATPVAVRAAVARGLLARLPDAAAADALALYDRYVASLDAADRLPFSAEPLARLAELRELRRRLLGMQAAEAFFGDEEAAIEARLVRRQLLSDPALTDTERAERLAAFDAALPEPLRAGEALQRALDADALSALYDEAGTDPDERFAERAELFGIDAAQRLAALDDERQRWQQRVDAYAALAARLASDPALSAQARERALQQYLQRQFEPAERRRLLAVLDEGGAR